MSDELRIEDPNALRRPAALPAAQLQDAIKAIVAAWNAIPGVARVRIVNQVRWRDIHELLRQFPLDDVLATIAWYARQEWNRAKRAWISFDRFIQADEFTRKFEAAAMDADRRSAQQSRQRAQAVRRQADQVDRQTAAQERQRLEQLLNAMPPADRQALLAEAATQLKPWMARLDHAVRMQALVILKGRQPPS